MANKNDKESGPPRLNPLENSPGDNSNGLPTLSDLLIGFQKSMARVAQATAKSTKEDPLFLYGRRNLYYIDEVDVETVVHIRPEEDPEIEGKKNFERIRILTEDKVAPSTGEPPAGWTKIKFKLVGRYLDERLDWPSIFIRLDRYRRRQRDYSIELQLMRADGTPAICENITVEVLPDALEKDGAVLSGLRTNELGMVKLRLVLNKDPKKADRIVATLRHGRLKSPEIPHADMFLVRAYARGKDMKPEVDIEKVTTYAPLIIDRSEFEDD